MLTSLAAFFISTLIATLVAPAVIAWYRSRGWMDDPQHNGHVKRTHSEPVPRGGGIVVMIAILLSSLLFLEIDKYLIGILVGCAVLTAIGIWDDIKDIHPLIRLIAGIVAGLIVVGSGIGIAYITNPLGDGVIHLNWPQIAMFAFGKTRTIWVLADLFALAFIIWNMNIVNWSKGVDGQMPGFVASAAVFIGLLSSRFADDPTQFHTMTFSFIVAGAFIGLLVWNFYPQKMLPGYGAGSLAGYLLAILAIISGAKLATTLMVLAVPTADAIFTITRRIIAGKSPLWGDRGHLHHKLLDVYGWGRRRIALFYWSTSVVLGVLSLYLNTVGKIIAVLVTMSLVFSLLIFAKLKQRRH